MSPKNSILQAGRYFGSIHFMIISFFFLGSNFFTAAQEEVILPSAVNPNTPHEVADHPYVPVNKSAQVVSPAYSFSSPGFTTTQVNVDEDGQNIVGDAANEPSIAHDPTNPQVMAIGWRHFETIQNNFRQAGIGYSDDGGETWTFQEVIDPGIFRSDPVLEADAQGNFFYNSLTVNNGDYWCDVYKSTDGGASWDMGTFAYGGDKQWFSIDKTSGPGAGNIYHHWTTAFSICYPHNFTRSVDAGASYEDCISIPGDPRWGTTVVDADGNLYIAGWEEFQFVVAKSSTAQFGDEPMTWDFDMPVSLDGEISAFGGYECPNPSGLLGQANITTDSSGGANHGNLYLLCSVARYSVNDPLDVMFARSTDGGMTWSDPVRVNDDPGTDAYQWFGTMSVAPDGRIDVVWLDTRENPGLVLSKLYYAASWDGGLSWSQNIPLGESFDPHVGWPQQEKMGDYFDMHSTLDAAHLAWAATFNGEQDVYYARIDPQITGMNPQIVSPPFRLEQNQPNPFRDETRISFFLPQQEHATLALYDLAGRRIAVLLSEDLEKGKHTVTYDASGLNSGMYYCTLTTGGYSQTIKIVRE